MIAGKLLEKSDEEALGGRLGYNAATDVFEDLVAVGVIDPVKVTQPVPACCKSRMPYAPLLRLRECLPGISLLSQCPSLLHSPLHPLRESSGI